MRPSDDAYIHYPKFHLYINEVINLTNLSERSIFFDGQCLNLGDQELFQGGTGFFMSRNAAWALFKSYFEVIGVVNNFEDWVLFNHFRKIYPIARDTSTNRYMGHGLNSKDWNKIQNDKFDFPRCPKNLDPRHLISCRKVLFSFNDVIFFHQLSGYRTISEWKDVVLKMPSDVYWYQQMQSTLCLYKRNIYE